jgi:hypothetical protein
LYSRDSILDLASGYSIDKESKFRWQHVQVIIQIPAGKKIRFDRSVNDKLNPVDFDYNDGHDYYWYRLSPDTDYTMGDDNLLRDGAGVPVRDNDYRYRRNNNYPDTTESLDYRERRAKEELRSIEEERRYKERQRMRDSAKEESIEDEDGSSGLGSSSPIFSLVSWAL